MDRQKVSVGTIADPRRAPHDNPLAMTPRRLLVTAVVVLCGVLAAACGGGPATGEDRASASEIAALASEAAEALDEAVAVSGEQLQEAQEVVSEAVATGDLGLQTPGVLLVGTNADFLPFVGRDEAGELTGFDVALVEALAAHMGLEPQWVDMAFPDLLAAVADDEVDVVASALTITDEREQRIDFTRPYFVASQALAAPAGTTLQGVADLDDETVVAVLADTTGEAYALETFDRAVVTSYVDRASALAALDADEVDAVFMDTDAVTEQARAGSLLLLEEVPTDERYGIGLAEGDAALRTALNEAIATLLADGTYEALFAQWFPARDAQQAANVIR